MTGLSLTTQIVGRELGTLKIFFRSVNSLSLHPWLLSSTFYGLSIHSVHFLLNIYFCGVAVNGIIFLILVYMCSLLVYRNTIGFCMLVLYFVIQLKQYSGKFMALLPHVRGEKRVYMASVATLRNQEMDWRVGLAVMSADYSSIGPGDS